MSVRGALTETSPGQTDRVAAALTKAKATASVALSESSADFPAMEESDSITIEEARNLTDEIKLDAEALWDKLARAYTERAWAALSYESWDAYCAAEFESLRLRLPREERQDIVCSLREAGLSIRAIASGVGISDQTVQRDLKAGVVNHYTSSPDNADDPIDTEVVEDVPDPALTDPPKLSPTQKKAQRRTYNNALTPLRVAAREMPALVVPVSSLVEDEEFRAWFAEAESRGPDVRREIAKAIKALEELRGQLP